MKLRRGLDVDAKVLPGAELKLNGVKFLVELDRGSMPHDRLVEERWPRYQGVSDFVLIVTSTHGRLQNMVENAKGTAFQGIALFTTLDAARQDACGEIWADCFGERASLRL